ncbi:MAG: phosphomannomutase [Candidatus Omnitrophica bacterium]|nr:phosphomannomutase [Candidatus Omnitrophota bacterium]
MPEKHTLPCFKAYDVRGKVPSELNVELAYKIGLATVQFLYAKKIVVGRDIRKTSEEIRDSLIRGLTDAGADVIDIGLCGTEMVYYAVSHLNADGGVMITASHNPPEYNGMKFVREDSKPISADTGLKDIEQMCILNEFSKADAPGSVETIDVSQEYVQHILSYVDVSKLKPYKLVVNAGNGCAGPIVDLLEPHLPFQFIKVHHEPDGDFPNGVPNPLEPKNRPATSEAVKRSQADAGIAWDGDFDRCFFFSEKGDFIDGYYIVGFLSQALLAKNPGGKIVYDPRLTWNTIEIVKQSGGEAVKCRSGHAFIKEKMRQNDAIYGGEMSAHHYFKDFFFCDSGMLPWLLILEIMSETGKTFSELVRERIEKFPCSGEINRLVNNPDTAIEQVREHFLDQNPHIDETDGIGMDFDQWRFNLRKSNTEPILRLNVESRANHDLLDEKTQEILSIIEKS